MTEQQPTEPLEDFDPVEVAHIVIYRDDDGYAASWDQGGTWDHSTPSGALAVVAEALDEWEDVEGRKVRPASFLQRVRRIPFIWKVVRGGSGVNRRVAVLLVAQMVFQWGSRP